MAQACFRIEVTGSTSGPVRKRALDAACSLRNGAGGEVYKSLLHHGCRAGDAAPTDAPHTHLQ